MKNLMSFVAVLIYLLICNSCEKAKTKVYKNDDLSVLRTAFGINGYRDILIKDNITTFKILASPTSINNVNNNLSNALVVITKNKNSLDISIKLENGITHSTIIDNQINKITFRHSNSIETTVSRQLKSDTTSYGLNCIDPICASNYIASIASIVICNDASITEFLGSIDFETYYGNIGDAPPCDPYYGYTIGWGFSSEASQDYEASVRNRASTKAAIAQYSCAMLGTSTSCMWGSNLFCVTVSTFRCCN
ncbi:MAG: hypothetical protein WCI92_10735 [Bacteroidota bacterium]